MSRDIDDVAFLGSPGLGTDDAGDAVDPIDDLGMPPGSVWVGMAAFDPISGIVDVHDHNPAVADESSGAIRFQAETGVGIMGAHSVYYAGHLDSDNHWIASESLYTWAPSRSATVSIPPIRHHWRVPSSWWAHGAPCGTGWTRR